MPWASKFEKASGSVMVRTPPHHSVRPSFGLSNPAAGSRRGSLPTLETVVGRYVAIVTIP